MSKKNDDFYVTVLGKRHRVKDPLSDLSVTPDIDKEFDEQAAKFGLWGVAAEEAAGKVRTLKVRVMEAEDDARYEVEQTAEKKLSIPTIESAIGRTRKVRKLRRRLVDAQVEAGKLRAIKEAFEQRAGQLQSKGALRRAELDQPDVVMRSRPKKRKKKKKHTEP